MKSYFFLLLLLSQSLLINAQSKGGKELYLTKSLANESVRNINVETSGGSISVTGVSAGEARIEVYVSANNSRDKNLTKEEIKKRIDEDYDLTVSASNNTLTAIAKPKRRNMDWRQSLNISFQAFVQKNVSTDLTTSGGSIHLSHISGEQSFSTSGGSLHVDDVSGKTKGRTSGGSIHLVNSKDDIDLATSGGSIDASACSGKINLSTSGGSMKLTNLSGDIDAQTSGGNVQANDVKGELSAHTSGGSIRLWDLACSLETSTSGGNIDVAIKEFGSYTKISNSGGNIDLQIPGNKGVDLKLHARRINTNNLSSFTGKTDDEEINGKLNGGGVSVNVNAGSGRINLSVK